MEKCQQGKNEKVFSSSSTYGSCINAFLPRILVKSHLYHNDLLASVKLWERFQAIMKTTLKIIHSKTSGQKKKKNSK